MLIWKHLAFLALVLHPGSATENNCSSVYNRIPGEFFSIPIFKAIFIPVHPSTNPVPLPAVNSDLTVDCGPDIITLEVNQCTAQWAGFNYTGLAMNGQYNNSLCLGIMDSSVDPPVVRQIVDESPGSGVFSSFSSIQSVIITGFIDTPRTSEGVISYSTDLYYHFSCRYPLEYFINNTQIVASSVSVATKGNNGTFINTLSMSVYNDSDYNNPLVVPEAGLALRTKIFVEVKATNLSGSCNINSRTTVELNGRDLLSRFYFDAFRFVEHHSQQKSSLYLHCIVRLCEPTKCQELLNACNGNMRKRREVVEPFGSEASESSTVSVGPIFTRDNDAVDQASSPESGIGAQQGERSESNTGLAVGLVFGCGATVLLVLGSWFVVKKFWMGGRIGSFR
ncbi:zona pellucida-like domain-containing protein 1 [Clupea harengus]|uniref:Zona pellucida-like domain-containing protein 1 n=1 Tax=Clupea harengus TaxID=7950 RepID=A0A6P8FLP9_CLUHA|nr:zona pellucida-like domain-containing protein 1 [Clupea harengus]